MSAAGLTPEIVERVASWLRQRPAPSARMSALCGAFERHAQAVLAIGRYRSEQGQAEAASREAAALGCLLALVRESLSCPGATTYRRDDGWRVSLGDREPYQRDGSPTEAEALLAALESAP